LAQTLGMTTTEDDNVLHEIFLKVESWLGSYPGAVQALDNAPRPQDYVRVYAGIRKQTTELLNNLHSLTEFYSEKYALEKDTLGEGGIDAIEITLAKLFAATLALEQRYEREQDVGRPKGDALCAVIKGLRKIFRKHYKGPFGARKERGAITALAEQEQRELSFVELALKDALISFRNLPRLFRDPRCALVEERNLTIERIVKNVRRARQRQQKGSSK